MANSTGKIKVTQVKSVIGTVQSHRACVRGLGLKRINHSVVVEDTPSNRGMITTVRYLLKSEVL
jgi:large subunit ribosomal protein L30